MLVNQVDNRLWFALNGLIRRAMVRNVPGFGPPKVVVNECPRSGGTWIGQMLAEYLQIPFPRNRLPLRRRCIVHGHYLRGSGDNAMVIVWRDGRDVMVSHYYHALIERPFEPPRRTAMNRRRLGIADVCDVQDVERYLPRFIEYCMTGGLSRSGLTWTSFADAWKDRSDCCAVRYEAMIEDPRREMTALLRAVEPRAAIDDARLAACIEKFSFETVTGRQRGEEDSHSFVRKGIVGDWKGKFTREARQAFDHYAGRTLIDLGYEPDRSWVENPPSPCSR